MKTILLNQNNFNIVPFYHKFYGFFAEKINHLRCGRQLLLGSISEMTELPHETNV